MLNTNTNKKYYYYGMFSKIKEISLIGYNKNTIIVKIKIIRKKFHEILMNLEQFWPNEYFFMFGIVNNQRFFLLNYPDSI